MRLFVVVLGLAVSAIAGCGESYSVNKVTGTVKLDGTPIVGAAITFSPTAGSSGMPAVGTTDENGVYSLTDMRGGDFGGGAVAGEYNVTVQWFKPSSTANASATGEDPGDGGNEAPEPNSHNKVTGPESQLPPAYTNAKTSGLTATVTAGENTVDLDLDSKYKPPKK